MVTVFIRKGASYCFVCVKSSNMLHCNTEPVYLLYKVSTEYKGRNDDTDVY